MWLILISIVVALEFGRPESQRQYPDPSTIVSQTAAQERARCYSLDYSSDTSLSTIRNQGNSPWCFAFTASDLASAQIGQKISALDIGFSHFETESGLSASIAKMRKLQTPTGATSATGDSVSNALKSGNSKGYCLESKFRSDDSGQNAFFSLIQILDSNSRSGANDSPGDLKGLYNLAKIVTPQLSYSDFIEVYRNKTAAQFLDAWRDKACEPRLKSNVENTTEWSKYKKAIDLIDRALNAGKPVGISYLPKECIGYKGKLHNAHASSVVARKYDESTHQCKYQLRNSWGTDWSQNGSVWMTEETLRSCVFAVTYIGTLSNKIYKDDVRPPSPVGH